MTNADRIRQMSDEELAHLFDGWISDCDCNSVPCKGPCGKTFGSKNCWEFWLEWLREEGNNGN